MLQQIVWSSERTLKVTPLNEENGIAAYFCQPLKVKEVSNRAASTWSGHGKQSIKIIYIILSQE